MTDRAQDTEAIRAALDYGGDYMPTQNVRDEAKRAVGRLEAQLAAESDRADQAEAADREAVAEVDRLVARLEAAEREVVVLRSERDLGAQTQRCTNPACTIISLGAGYEACPKCASPLAALAAAAPGETEQTPQPTCYGYCGSLGWTIREHGRVTHKQSCPHRCEPWCQAHPAGCPPDCKPLMWIKAETGQTP